MKFAQSQPTSHRWIKGLAILLLLGMVGQSFTAIAGSYKPKPGIGKSSRRIGLGTRGDCGVSAASPQLTALVPVDSNGLSTTPYPTFAWYMPEHTYNMTEFRLTRVNAAQGLEQTIYFTKTQNPTMGQFQSLRLPKEAGVPALEEGLDYRWDIILWCDPDEPSGNLLAQGWIRYEAPTAKLFQQLQGASPLQTFELMAENGYWYDAVTILQTQLHQNPDNVKAKQLWQSLMTQDEVRLGHLVMAGDAEPPVQPAP